MPERITVQREKLYEEVWTTPLRHLAKQYGISDVALGKICRKLNIPRPGLGYWAKIEAGGPHNRVPLPARADITTVEIHPTPPTPTETEAEREVRIQREAQIARFAHFRVPDTIERPHPLTRRTQQHFEDIKRKLKRSERTKPGLNSDWVPHPYDRNGRYFCSPSEGFDVLLSLDSMDRALRFLDTLAKALEKNGFVLKPQLERRKLEALKGGEATAFELREGYKWIPLDPEEVRRQRAINSWARDHEYKGSGKLILKMCGETDWPYKEWQDGKSPLEAQLPEILAEFVGYPDAIKARRAEKAREVEERAHLARITAQTHQRIEAEKKELERFIMEAHHTATLHQASQYLALVEERFSAEGLDPSGATAAWLINMRRLINQADPLPARLDTVKTLTTRSQPQPSHHYFFGDE